MIKEIEAWAVVELVGDQKIILGVIRTPDARERALLRAEEHRAEGRTVEVERYYGKTHAPR